MSYTPDSRSCPRSLCTRGALARHRPVRTPARTPIGPHGTFIGMTGFGDSAPAEVLFDHFGITADAIVKAAQK